jgi:outer membrane usher protein FimD/PapC
MSPRYGLVFGYAIFFFASDRGEPPHVHISRPATPQNNSKFWIADNSATLAHNNANISQRDLNRIETYLQRNSPSLLAYWNEFFK